MTRRAALVPVVALVGLCPCAGDNASGARAPDGATRRTIQLGRSVDGRPITAVEIGDSDNPAKTLVVGCIHGNEPAGIAVAARLTHMRPAPETDLWIISDLNPDGVADRKRGNARGVDLNRNFPSRWTRLAGIYYSGPRPLSEPETRIAYRLISRVRPSISIWFHQHLDVVDDSSGSRRLERRFAHVARLRMAALRREPGGAVLWESHRFHLATSFVVELPAGALAPAAVARFAEAVRATAALERT